MAERMGMSRNAWIVQTLVTELEGVAPAPVRRAKAEARGPVARVVPAAVGLPPPNVEDPPVRQARIEATGSYGYRAVDADTGDTIEGTVRNMRHAAEDEARRLGYEVVDSL